jgi:restriction system protein
LGGSGRPEEVEETMADQLGLSEKERNEQIPSGQSRFSNKVNWARFYLAKAGLIDSSTRGVWSLTEKGRTAFLTPEQALELFNQVHKPFV